MDIRRQLNEARLQHALTLEQIAMRTALSASVLRHLDEGRFERLPPGLYARSYVRAFAAEVGLDPETTLARLEHLLPGAPNPLPALNAKEHAHAKRAPGTFSHASDKVSALLSTWTVPAPAGLRTNVGTTYEFFEDVPRPVSPRTNDRGPFLRIGAVAIDVLVLAAVNLLVLLLVALTSAIPVNALLRDAGWAVATLGLILMAMYFLLFGGIGGSTIGRYTFSLHAPSARHPLTLADICRRALVGR